MKITIVGSGFIGRSWAMLFASGGHSVALFDISKAQLDAALIDIKNQMDDYKQKGLLKGTLTVEEQCHLITTCSSLEDAVANASHIQECASEDLTLKTKLFEQLDGLIDDACTVASSTSTLPPSQFTANLQHKSQCLVAHPINPPYLMPLVELVMAPWTSPDAVSSVRQLMTSVGQQPITLKKEVRGFIQPRLQYAAIQECLRLVRDGVMSVEDVDKVMSHGLGLRYAFLGPFEVIHLNANGVRDYMQRYWKGLICDVLADEGLPMDLRANDPAMIDVDQQLRQSIPLDGLEQERKRRNELIGSFYKTSRRLDQADQSLL